MTEHPDREFMARLGVGHNEGKAGSMAKRAGLTFKPNRREQQLITMALGAWAPKLGRVYAGPAGMGYSEDLRRMVSDRVLLQGDELATGLIGRISGEQMLDDAAPPAIVDGKLELTAEEQRVMWYGLRWLSDQMSKLKKEEEEMGHDTDECDGDLRRLGTWDPEKRKTSGGLLKKLYGGWEDEKVDPEQTAHA